MTYYKVLVGNKSSQQSHYEWVLPTQDGDGNWIPSAWHEVDGTISVCERGLHLTTTPHRWYVWDADIYEAEGEGDSDTEEDKTAFRRARLLKKLSRPEWLNRAVNFISMITGVSWLKTQQPARKEWAVFLGKDLAAARAAARAAAWAAAGDAAWAAAGAAAGDAAWAAAWDAARDAAWAAAGAAAGDAAWAAARDAAGDAARDAGLLARLYTVADIDGIQPHLQHALDRWAVWQASYGLLCDINGVLYVYGIRQKSDMRTAFAEVLNASDGWQKRSVFAAAIGKKSLGEGDRAILESLIDGVEYERREVPSRIVGKVAVEYRKRPTG